MDSLCPDLIGRLVYNIDLRHNAFLSNIAHIDVSVVHVARRFVELQNLDIPRIYQGHCGLRVLAVVDRSKSPTATGEKGGCCAFTFAPLVATQYAIYQTSDIGNTETWAAVAMVAIASVIDRSATPVVAASVSRAVTATSVPAPGVSVRCMSAYCLSAAVTVAGVVGSYRTSRDRQTTEHDSGSDSNYCFVHEFLLLGSSRQCQVASNSCWPRGHVRVSDRNALQLV
jgi:hypothetical protein